MSIQGQAMKYARNGKRRKGVPDLNVPPVENPEQAAGPTVSPNQSGQVDEPAVTVVHGGQVHDGQVHEPVVSTPPAPIDVDEIDDDDVVISSPRTFEEAKKKSQRRLVIDVDAAEEVAIRLGNQTNKRRRNHPNPPTVNCELYVNLEESSDSMREKRHYVAPQPPPTEPTFNCPICSNPLVEAVTTKCGHIFCKACITAAIKTQHKCPTCRQKLTNRNLIRVYLPATK